MTEITCEEAKDFVSKTSYIGELHSLYVKRDACLAVKEYIGELLRAWPDVDDATFDYDKNVLIKRISELDNRIKEVEEIVRR